MTNYSFEEYSTPLRACDLPQTFEEMNSRFAHTIIGGASMVYDIKLNMFFKKEAISDLMNGIYYAGDGEESRPLFRYWMSNPNRIRFSNVVFNPKGKAAPGELNMFMGLEHAPDPTASCEHFKRFMREVICNGDDAKYWYLWNLLAWIAQNVGVKPSVALVMRGDQGTGKGTFATWIGEMFGQRYFLRVNNPDKIYNNFNIEMMGKLVIFFDEAVWSGSHKAKSRIKAYITEDRLLVEGKHKDAQEINSYCFIMIATNEEWAAPMDATERRFFVTDVSARYANNRAYFDALEAERQNGGMAKLLYELTTHQIDKEFNSRLAPVTMDGVSQVIRSQSPFCQYLYYILEKGELHHQHDATKWEKGELKVKVNDLLLDMVAWNRDFDKKREIPSARSVGMILKSMGFPKSSKAKGGLSVRTFPKLAEARDMFAGYLSKGKYTWDEIEGEPTEETGKVVGFSEKLT